MKGINTIECERNETKAAIAATRGAKEKKNTEKRNGTKPSLKIMKTKREREREKIPRSFYKVLFLFLLLVRFMAQFFVLLRACAEVRLSLCERVEHSWLALLALLWALIKCM